MVQDGVFQDFGNSGFASNLGDGVDGGGTGDLGDGGGEGDGNRGMVGISSISESVVETTINKSVSFSFSFGFTFDNMSDKSSMSISSNVCAVFVDNSCASLLVFDFFAGNIVGDADGVGTGSTRLDFNFLG